MPLHWRWAVLGALALLVSHSGADTEHRYYPREPRQLQLQLELSLTTPKPCQHWAVRWEGRRAHPAAAALRASLATAVAPRVRQALAPARLALTLHLACSDPPRGQDDRRLRATIIITAAHPHWQLPTGAAATLLGALREPDVLRAWVAAYAAALPEKYRSFGLLHLFAYRDARFAPVCVRGVALPGLARCPPNSLRWHPAAQATYSECTPDPEGPDGQVGCPYDIWHYAGYPWCFKCVDGKCQWDEYKWRGIGQGVDKWYCVNGYDTAENSCQYTFHPTSELHSHLLNTVYKHGAGNWWMQKTDTIEQCCVECVDRPSCIGFEWHPGTVQKCRLYTSWKDASCEYNIFVPAYHPMAKMGGCAGWTY